jgi:hypothetical protein
MLTAVVRRAAALRQPRAAAKIARILWTTWAIVVWNVVFDHVIVVAGRDYVAAASAAAGTARNAHPQYLAMDDWMRPAVIRGLWLATAAAGTILVLGLALITVAARGSAPLLSDR